MASRKGCDVALAVAGLPYARDRVVEAEGNTYMRRAKPIHLGLLNRRDVRETYSSLLGCLRRYGVDVEDEALDEMVGLSKGQPFLMQLLGYEVVEELQGEATEGGRSGGSHLVVSQPVVERSFRLAMDSYAAQSLEPLLAEAESAGRAYLTAMAEAMGPDGRIVRSADVAAADGRPANSLTAARARLIRLGIIVAPRRGELRFNVPYLREYLLEEHGPGENEALLDEWDV